MGTCSHAHGTLAAKGLLHYIICYFSRTYSLSLSFFLHSNFQGLHNHSMHMETLKPDKFPWGSIYISLCLSGILVHSFFFFFFQNFAAFSIHKIGKDIVLDGCSWNHLQMDVTIHPKAPTMGLTHWAQLVGLKASLSLRAHPTPSAFIGPHHTILYTHLVAIAWQDFLLSFVFRALASHPCLLILYVAFVFAFCYHSYADFDLFFGSYIRQLFRFSFTCFSIVTSFPEF